MRPCIAFLHTDAPSATIAGETSRDKDQSLLGESLIPKLNTTEVAAVFSAPFHRFLSSKTEETGSTSLIRYEGAWQTWHGTKWRMHNFFIPKNSTGIGSTRSGDDQQVGSDTSYKENSYRVWGLTARILIDSARIAYDEEPEFDYLKDIGEEKLLHRLLRLGKLSGERGKGSTMPRESAEKVQSDDSDSGISSDKGSRGMKL